MSWPIEFVRIAEHGWAETAYAVYEGGVLVGKVESWRSESWRKAGRLRTTLRGRPKYWAAYKPDGSNATRYAHTRADAVARLRQTVTQHATARTAREGGPA